VDNLAHTLCGLALARCGLDRWRGATAVCAVGANLPDIDHVVLFSSEPYAYLRYHRGITHSLAGIAVETVLLAGVAYAIERRAKADVKLAPLVLAAAVGLLSHLALDSLNSYGVRPFLPWSDARYFGDLAYIVDPWLWLGFGAAAYLGATRGPRLTALWAAIAIVCALATAIGGGAGPVPVVIFVGACVWIAYLQRTPFREKHSRRLVAGWLAAVGVYLFVLVASWMTPSLSGKWEVVGIISMPGPVCPWRRQVIVEEPRGYTLIAYDAFTGDQTFISIGKNLDDPALAKLQGTRAFEAWRSFARHPFVARTNHHTLILGDARYDPRPEPSWCNIEVPLPD
jgi:inner membrane protein